MAAWSTKVGSNIKNVDPRLRDIMEKAAVAFAQENPGYSVVGISGKTARKSGTKQHPAGWAVDVDIVDPTGKHLGNFQDAKSFRTYEKFGQLARAYQKQAYPELTRDFRAGMYFSGKWHHDQMHFDINPKMKGAMKYGSWEEGLTKAGRRALPGAESVGMNAFPAAPSGPTGWPTPAETGPGIYGALNPEVRAQQYAAAGNRRAYEQGFRPAPAAMPQDFSGTQIVPGRYAPAFTAPAAPATQAPVAFANTPMARPDAVRMGDMSLLGGGTLTPSLASALAAGNLRGSLPPASRPDINAPTAQPSIDIGQAFKDAIAGKDYTPSVDSVAPTQARVGTPDPSMQPAPPANLAANPIPGLGTVTPTVAEALRPQQGPPAPTTPVAAPSAYPDESRFSMKKGLTPADMVQMGLTPAPALTKREPVKEAPIKEVQQQETVIKSPVKTVAAPTIAPAIVAGQPPPAKPGGLIGALENLAAPLSKPFHTLANIAGPVPNPKSFDYGTGAQAIGDALSGATQSKPGAVSYSKSTPGYSIKSLGNGMVEKTNQYGHKSYEHVGGLGTPGSGIFSGQQQPGGLLGGFGLPGLGSAIGGLFGGTGFGNTANVGPNAFGYAGPWGAGTAPATGGGLFGSFDGGFGGGGKSTGGRRGGGTSTGGRGSMSAGSGGLSHSTRY